MRTGEIRKIRGIGNVSDGTLKKTGKSPAFSICNYFVLSCRNISDTSQKKLVDSAMKALEAEGIHKVALVAFLIRRLYMEVTLLRANIDNAKELHAMQVESFKELLEKYQDFDTSPANESMEKVEARLKQDFTFYYFICIGQQKVGAVRIIDKKENGKNKRISPIFILPEFQGKGIAQKAIRLCEEIHGDENWELDTILQESKNCHLYEKMGYRQTGKTEVINERLTLIFYEKKAAELPEHLKHIQSTMLL